MLQQTTKRKAKLILLVSFFIGLVDRIVSHILYVNLSKDDYLTFYYNMVNFEMLVFSFTLLLYAFLFNLCKFTKTAIIANTAFCLLDLIFTVFNFSNDLIDVYSIIITVISAVFIGAELLFTKITKKC